VAAGVKVEPDSSAAVSASDLLHPAFVPGLPPIITTLQPPEAVQALAPPQELAALKRAAASARRERQARLRRRALEPPSPAVGRTAVPRGGRACAKRPDGAHRGLRSAPSPRPARCSRFSQLGPLTGRFPRSSLVRFHLGVLLIWSQELAKARKQLGLAISLDPSSQYAVQAKRLLTALVVTGTKQRK
jgi:hypothetical protein